MTIRVNKLKLFSTSVVVIIILFVSPSHTRAYGLTIYEDDFNDNFLNTSLVEANYVNGDYGSYAPPQYDDPSLTVVGTESLSVRGSYKTFP